MLSGSNASPPGLVVSGLNPIAFALMSPAIGLKMIQTTGYLTRYKLPGAKKLIQPREFQIMWNLVVPQPA